MKRIILCIFAFCINIYIYAWSGYTTDIACWSETTKQWVPVAEDKRMGIHVEMDYNILVIYLEPNRPYEYHTTSMVYDGKDLNGNDIYFSDAISHTEKEYFIKWVQVKNDIEKDLQIYLYGNKLISVFNVKIIN